MSEGMSGGQAREVGDEAPPPTGDDTAAFQRFYQSPQAEPRGVLYRLFVGWWREKRR